MIYDNPLINSIYSRSPVAFQHMLVTLYGVLKVRERKSKAFRNYIAELEKTQWLTPVELQQLQQERLQGLVRHAYENVPYYRRVFDERKLKPGDIQTPDDLYKLPILTKQELRQYRDDLRARNIPDSETTIGRTGGTTGIPLAFRLDKNRVTFDRALTYRQWGWAGYTPGDRVVILRGFTLIPAEVKSGIYWRHDWAERRIYLSGFHLSTHTMPLYVKMLKEWKPTFLAGYPSSIYTLARYMEQAGETCPVAAVFVSSEAVTPEERRVIEERFCCKVWDRYGTGERLAVSQQCEVGNYHNCSEYGIMQVDSPLGEPAAPGVKGEVVQTGLTNFSMPLIRFAMEDIGYVVEGECPCGRGLPMMGPVDGRKDDAIITADGRMMPRAGLDQIHEFVENMERCQLVQERLGSVTIKVVPRLGFNQADEHELIEQLQRRIGKDTDVQVVLVGELPLTVNGKERFIVSRVGPEELQRAQMREQVEGKRE